MIIKLSIQSIPEVTGLDTTGKPYIQDKWRGVINAESAKGFLYKISLTSKNDVNEIIKAINQGLSHIVESDKNLNEDNN